MHTREQLYIGTIHNVPKRDLCWALWNVISSDYIRLIDWYPGHRLWGPCLCARCKQVKYMIT